ncbi:hypothetical protein GA707_17365 [Nostocoides sp. F2B08]|uniref:hypothetical protein n=1 Tax=Nostocoides sp. F2B08 TaxID=2653936 RepID=UPI001262EA4E|nr:hypothetical protein [Tetrasphaera sp. F2B08]KAB7741961.1 hypothetical protein GA707_17365 [Tetrasphaera sp. F2B08]
MTIAQVADQDVAVLRTEYHALHEEYVDTTRRLKEIADLLRHTSYESTEPEVLALYLEVLKTLGSHNYTHLDLAGTS